MIFKDENTIKEVVIGEYDVSKDLDCPTCGKVQRFTPEKIIQHKTYLDNRYKGIYLHKAGVPGKAGAPGGCVSN